MNERKKQPEATKSIIVDLLKNHYSTRAINKLMSQLETQIRNEERTKIKKSINEYYGRPEVEQGIVGFREAVRYALSQEE